MDRIEILKKLIALETDEAQLKAYRAELEDAYREQGREEAKAEAKAAIETAEHKAAQARSEAKNNTTTPDVKVGNGKTELYKGKYNLNREVEFAGARALTNKDAIDKRFSMDKNKAMHISKMFIDKFEAAQQPGVLNALKAGDFDSAQKAALEEGTAGEGGYLTPTEERFEMLAYARERSLALQYATHIPMTSDSMTIPRELTNISVVITAEESEATESEPTFDQVTLTANRIDAYGVTSNELMQDAALNGGLTGLLLDQFIEATGKKIDSVTFIGTGSPMSGIFLAAGYSVVLGTGSSTFSDVSHSSILETMSKVAEEDAENARFWMHRTPRLVNIRTIEDTAGNPLYIQNAIASEPPTLMGYPVHSSSQMPGTTAVSTAILVFGDLRGVYIGDRLTNFAIMLDPYTKMTYYQTRFFFATRWGFARALPNKFSRLVTAAS